MLDSPQAISGASFERNAPADGWNLNNLPSTPAVRDRTDSSPTASKRRLPAIVDAAKMIAEPRVIPEELVVGLLHRGAKMVVGGGSKTFKTWVLLDLALSVATGKP